jgi:ELWxxDGT repeat protein
MLATGSSLNHPPKTHDKRAIKSIALSVLFLLSLFAHFDFSSSNQQDFFEINTMNAGGSDGYHSSSPIVISGSTNVSFIQGEQPYRWFSIEGYQGPTYVNITANTSTSDYYSQGRAKGYTAYDQCFSSWFTVGYGVSSMCSNPSGNPTILFSISFLNTADGSSRLSQNLSLEVSIGEYIAPAPPTVTAYPYPDGDTNADSDSSSSPSVDVAGEGSYGFVQGFFESRYDEDRIMFNSQYSGTHRLNLTFNTPGSTYPLASGDLFQCVESDNTGLQKILQYTNGGSFTPVGQILYFQAYDGINGYELWKSDGTASGTVMVKDINSGSGSSSPSQLTAVGNTLYFRANDGANGDELWKSDGTVSGTMMVKDIDSGSGSSSPASLTAVGNTLYFQANDGNNGYELWKSDGTAAGTVLVKDINSGSSSSNPSQLTAVGNTLYFQANDGDNGAELWKSDGTASGTVLVKDIYNGYSGSSAYGLTPYGNDLYFIANDGVYGYELWKSDGTASGTVLVKDINVAGGWSTPAYLTFVGNTLYFRANDGANGDELWKSDGTASGTMMVKDIYSGSGSSSPQGLTAVGNTLYFQVYDGTNGYELWKSDGTAAGTVLVKDINNGSSSSNPNQLTAVGNTLYFQANDGVNGNELWKSDGTASGTVIVKDIDSGSSSSNPGSLTVIGTTLYFEANGAWYSLMKSTATVYEGYFDCLIIADSGVHFGVEFEPSETDSSAYPMQWSVSTTLEQVYPLEDLQRGDSKAYAALPPLMQHNDTASGVYNFYNDQDDYSIAIEHGTMQHIVVTTDASTEVQFSSGECGREGEAKFSTLGLPQNVQLDSSVPSHTFWCDTRYIADEIRFSLKHFYSNGNTNLAPSPNAYSIDVFTTPLNSTFSPTLDRSVTDAPARGVLPVITYPETFDGSFRHWSDQTDRYQIITAPGEDVLVNLASNCATLTTYKSGYYETVSVDYGGPVQWQGNLPNGSEIYTFDVNRLHLNDIHDVELKDTCVYTIETSINTAQQSTYYSEYSFSNYEDRLSPTSPVVIDNFSDYLPENTSTETYKFSIPFDVLPTMDGYIEATQASGEVPVVTLSGTQTRTNSGTMHLVGQHIEVTGQRVQWNQITVSDLDGSEFSLSFVEEPLTMLTMEGNELFSRANGALGVSRDEGWDTSDTWYFNTTAIAATHASVRISSLTDGLKATFDDEFDGPISQFVCFSGGSDSVTVYHQNGSGDYELEVIYGYGACSQPNYSIPNSVPVKSSFEVSAYNGGSIGYTWQIYDANLNQVYQGFTATGFQVITLPESMLEGTYRALLVDEGGVVYIDHRLEVIGQPTRSVSATNMLLDGRETPKLEIQSIMPFSGEPLPWTFSNITVSSISNNGEKVIEPFEKEFAGLGSRVIEIDELSNTMAGSLIMLQGDLQSATEKTTHFVYWSRTFYTPDFDCEEQIIPNTFSPENDILCLISFNKRSHLESYNYGFTEHQITGTFDIYDDELNLLSQSKFSNDLFRPTAVRIDAGVLGFGDYFAKVNFSDQIGIYIQDEVGAFSVGDYIFTGNTEDSDGQFDFGMISVRDTAAAGDDLLLAWSTSGGESKYFFIEVFAENELVDSYYVLNDGSQDGQFKITLPDDRNPYLDHSIRITAFDNLMTAVNDVVSVEGKSQQVYLEVNVNPDRPTVGSMVEVELMISTDDKWLAWSWALQSSSSSSSDVLANGDGFVNSNKGSFKFNLPLSQYTSTPYLHITAESEDGTLYTETIPVDPVPLRSVSIDVDSNMVVGKDYDVEWEVTGKYLNSVDEVERIEFVIFTMDYEQYHQEVYFVGSDSGEFSVLAPTSLNPGSHRIGMVFTFTDGETYEHSQIITVQSTPDGITLFGLTIPPIAMGFDTLIVLVLIVHAVFLHRRGLKPKPESDLKDEHWEQDQDLSDLDGFEDEANVEEPKQEMEAYVENQEEYDEPTAPEPEENVYPMYQEYPSGSGHHWVRYSEDVEWELIDV